MPERDSLPRLSVGAQLRHHSGGIWEVIAADLPGDGDWHGGMVEVRGDYRIRCVAASAHAHPDDCAGKELRVHSDYLHGDGWRRADA